MRRTLSLLAILAMILPLACAEEAEEPLPETAATVEEAPADDDDQSPWVRNAAEYRGKHGERFEYVCSGPFTQGNVWGTAIYTDDSAVCTAAVHAGVIDRSGGTVTIEARPGLSSYVGTSANGVDSRDYGSWNGSFVFVDADGNAIEPPASLTSLISWEKTAASWDQTPGYAVEATCAANGTLGSVWGTDLYTADSSVCTAAVHAGLIDLRAGGPVKLEMRPGASSYEGSTRNGVESKQYGEYGSSFAFVE